MIYYLGLSRYSEGRSRIFQFNSVDFIDLELYENALKTKLIFMQNGSEK